MAVPRRIGYETIPQRYVFCADVSGTQSSHTPNRSHPWKTLHGLEDGTKYNITATKVGIMRKT